MRVVFSGSLSPHVEGIRKSAEAFICLSQQVAYLGLRGIGGSADSQVGWVAQGCLVGCYGLFDPAVLQIFSGTLQIGLRYFVNQEGGTQWGLFMAAAVLVSLPVVVIYFTVQKQFVEGIATTGLKGT